MEKGKAAQLVDLAEGCGHEVQFISLLYTKDCCPWTETNSIKHACGWKYDSNKGLRAKALSGSGPFRDEFHFLDLFELRWVFFFFFFSFYVLGNALVDLMYSWHASETFLLLIG